MCNSCASLDYYCTLLIGLAGCPSFTQTETSCLKSPWKSSHRTNADVVYFGSVPEQTVPNLQASEAPLTEAFMSCAVKWSCQISISDCLLWGGLCYCCELLHTFTAYSKHLATPYVQYIAAWFYRRIPQSWGVLLYRLLCTLIIGKQDFSFCSLRVCTDLLKTIRLVKRRMAKLVGCLPWFRFNGFPVVDPPLWTRHGVPPCLVCKSRKAKKERFSTVFGGWGTEGSPCFGSPMASWDICSALSCCFENGY